MNENGLEAVFMAQRTALARFLAARGAASDVEDLLQDLWFKIISGTPGPISEPVAYLYRMADNLLLDRRRSEQRRTRRNEDWSTVTSGSTEVSDQPSVERILIGRETLQAVEQVLSGLGERTSLIFRRFRIEGIGQREIAAEQGLSLSAVEKHLQKAYRALLDLNNVQNADIRPSRRPSIEGVDDVRG